MPAVSVQFALILEAYCRGGIPHIEVLKKQVGHTQTHACALSYLWMDECPCMLREVTKNVILFKSVKSWSCLLLFSVDPDRISFMVFLTHHSDSCITFLTSNLCLLEASHFLLFPQENSQLSGRFPLWENLQSVLELQS